MMEGTARKETRKEKPGVSKNFGATQSYKNTLDSNSYLTYDILRIIFQYLNARDLGSAAMVCRSWSEAANDEKSTRGPCQLYTLTRESLISYIKNIRIKPSVGLFFIPEFTSRVRDRIEDLLPEHCGVIILYCKYVLDNYKMERSENISSSTVCAFFPQIPNVKIKFFELVEHCVIEESAEYQEIIKTIVDHETSISNTCFMLFCNYFHEATARRWASAMQESKEVKIASVCGGMVDEMLFVPRTRKTKKRPKKDANCVAVLIIGTIQTWSTILDRECNTIEQIEARLKLFKDKVKLKKHSIGFMFATICNDWEELTIFKRLFPKVPLAGCFGFGVFGKTTVDEVNEEKNDEEEHQCKESKSWLNEIRTTVFLILTYG